MEGARRLHPSWTVECCDRLAMPATDLGEAVEAHALPELNTVCPLRSKAA